MRDTSWAPGSATHTEPPPPVTEPGVPASGVATARRSDPVWTATTPLTPPARVCC